MRLHVYTTNPMVNARAEVNEVWTDTQQVSAYVNMREVIKWWKEKCVRKSLYGNDSIVYIFTHTPYRKDDAMVFSTSV